MPTFRYHKARFTEIRNARRLRKVRRAALALSTLLLLATALMLLERSGHWPLPLRTAQTPGVVSGGK